MNFFKGRARCAHLWSVVVKQNPAQRVNPPLFLMRLGSRQWVGCRPCLLELYRQGIQSWGFQGSELKAGLLVELPAHAAADSTTPCMARGHIGEP